jgi:hypothetical protein
MPSTWTKIDKYEIIYIAGGRGTSGFNNQYRAIIALMKNDGANVWGKNIGIAYFYKNSSAMPNTDSKDESGDCVSLNYTKEDFQNVLNILRGEKVAWLYWDGDWNTGYIYSGMDPIGEGGHTTSLAFTLNAAKTKKKGTKR